MSTIGQSGPPGRKYLWIALRLAAIYLLALLAMFAFQRRLLFHPGTDYLPPEAAGAPAGLRELAVRTEDGLDLEGWYAPATSRPVTLVFFHGNADSLASAAPLAGPYMMRGYGVLVAEYRGYSGLPGSPSEDGLYRDGRAFLDALVGAGVPAKDIVLFGHSLGTGVAVEMATEFPVRGLILWAPYTSIGDAAQAHYPIFPASYLVLDRFASRDKMAAVRVPVLMGNGGHDGIIPPDEGRTLFALANEPKRFHFSPEGDHGIPPDFVLDTLDWLEPLAAGR